MRVRIIGCGQIIRAIGLAAMLLVLAGTSVSSVSAYPGARSPDIQHQARSLPESVAGLLLPLPRHAGGDLQDVLPPSLLGRQGPQQVLIRLNTPPVADPAGRPGGGAEQHRRRVIAQQDAFLLRAAALAPDIKVLGRLQLVLNAVLAEADVTALGELLNDPAVARISEVVDYSPALSDTVPYIGGEAVHDLGLDGSGVRVAVLDSGIDYTHASLGGTGTRAAYRGAYGSGPADGRNTTRDGLFPTDRWWEGTTFWANCGPSPRVRRTPTPSTSTGTAPMSPTSSVGGRAWPPE